MCAGLLSMLPHVRSGQNQPISPGQLGSALGPEIIKTFAQRSGLAEDALTKQLSLVIPGVVDKLIPWSRAHRSTDGGRALLGNRPGSCFAGKKGATIFHLISKSEKTYRASFDPDAPCPATLVHPGARSTKKAPSRVQRRFKLTMPTSAAERGEFMAFDRTTARLLITCIGVMTLVIPAPRVCAEVLISVDKNTQRMSVSVDGVRRYEFAVSTGRPNYGTRERLQCLHIILRPRTKLHLLPRCHRCPPTESPLDNRAIQ
jgi:hypothetical protein